jgi:predicted nucleic acid-binding protein
VRFVDTNVLIYAAGRLPGDETRRREALRILKSADLALSAQVLQEFYVQATRATRPDAISHAQAEALVVAWSRFPIQPITTELVLAAMASHVQFNISFWDAAIIEAARMLGCTEVLSEDLNHGQDYDGVTVVNPFR